MTNRPLPDYIYRRRRIGALLVLLVVIALTLWAMTSCGGGKKSDPQPTATNAFDKSSQVPTPGPTSSGTATPAPTATATPTPALSPTPVAALKTTCSVSDLVVEARANQPTYGPDERPTFYLTIKNPTKADCKVDLRKDGLKFEVYDLANNSRVWADTDCNPSEDSSERVFPAGQERHYEAVWSRTTSAPGKCDNRQPVPAGSYFLHTLVGQNHSDPFPFNVN